VIFLNLDIDNKVHNIYNEDGKSFGELLAEGIKQANLGAIYKQIITSGNISPAASEKEVSQ